MHHRVETVVASGHAEQAVEDLPVVGQVDPHEPGPGHTVAVEADHLMTVGPEPLHGGRAELAGAAGDRDAHGHRTGKSEGTANAGTG